MQRTINLMTIDWRGIARRIRGLASLSDKAVLTKTAARLDVTEQELADTIDAASPTSAVKVIRAVVRVYGLDPSWVVTGRYDAETHRAAMQPDSAAFEEVMSRLLGERVARTSTTAPARTAAPSPLSSDT